MQMSDELVRCSRFNTFNLNFADLDTASGGSEAETFQVIALGRYRLFALDINIHWATAHGD